MINKLAKLHQHVGGSVRYPRLLIFRVMQLTAECSGVWKKDWLVAQSLQSQVLSIMDPELALVVQVGNW